MKLETLVKCLPAKRPRYQSKFVFVSAVCSRMAERTDPRMPGMGNRFSVTHVSRNISRLTIQQHTTKDLLEIRLHIFQVELFHVVFDVSHFS